MKFFKNKSAFTFVEMVISVLISSLILGGIFYFIADNIDEISYSTKKMNFFDSFYNFRDDITYNYNKYSSGVILIDNNPLEGSDVLLLQNNNGTDGIVIGSVDTTINKIENTSDKYNTYYKKVLGFKRVSQSEILDIKTNSGNVYDILFYDDNIYQNLIVKDFQVDFYNTGSIINMDISLVDNYDDIFVGNIWNNVQEVSIFKTNLNF